MIAIKQIEKYRIKNDKYVIHLEIDYENCIFNIYNEKMQKEFLFGGLKLNRNKQVAKMIYFAVDFASKKLCRESIIRTIEK
jgi:hypothetical protein